MGNVEGTCVMVGDDEGSLVGRLEGDDEGICVKLGS